LVAFTLLTTAVASAGDPPVLATERRNEMSKRALGYLLTVQRDGAFGDSRQHTVTGLFILAALSTGATADNPRYGTAITAAATWLIENSSADFFGGREAPSADHAVAALALTELVGLLADDPGGAVYAAARRAAAHSLQLQNKGVDAAFYGGWRPHPRTRVNDRVLSAWFLLQLRSAQIRGINVPRSNLSRATAFIGASQKKQRTAKADERGGFSVDAQGLAVPRTTAAGTAVLALFDGDHDDCRLAVDWLTRNPPRWYGPNFFETSFFAVRGLYHLQELDNGNSYRRYFARLVQLLRERQQPDGSMPFPPGHGGPLLAMGPAYATAMAVLILNVDRGILPMDVN
jgi:hypothetical protein